MALLNESRIDAQGMPTGDPQITTVYAPQEAPLLGDTTDALKPSDVAPEPIMEASDGIGKDTTTKNVRKGGRPRGSKNRVKTRRKRISEKYNLLPQESSHEVEKIYVDNKVERTLTDSPILKEGAKLIQKLATRDLSKDSSFVDDALQNIPTNSDQAEILKKVILKCVDRVRELELDPIFDKTRESLLRDYLGEIRENVMALNKISDVGYSEKQIKSSVEEKIGFLLDAFEEVIMEVCPKDIATIKERLLLKINSIFSDPDGRTTE